MPKFNRAAQIAAVVVAVFVSPCFAQYDPGVRGGPAGAGDPIPGLSANQLDMFNEGRF